MGNRWEFWDKDILITQLSEYFWSLNISRMTEVKTKMKMKMKMKMMMMMMMKDEDEDEDEDDDDDDDDDNDDSHATGDAFGKKQHAMTLRDLHAIFVFFNYIYIYM